MKRARPRLMVALLHGLVSGHAMTILDSRFEMPRAQIQYCYAARVNFCSPRALLASIAIEF
jgi:hypothetical protein